MLSGLTPDEAIAQGLSVVQIEPTALIPHPFNDTSRSIADEGDESWRELLVSVEEKGVRIAAAAVTRKAFTARWPHSLKDDTHGEYVLIYGHRRRAAALATGTATMPVIVDDTILDSPDGGLLDMFKENHAREGLSPLAEAEFLARLAEELHISQREIGKAVGLSQPTVQRRLSLIFLEKTLQNAVRDKRLSPTEGSTLGSLLPYGPVRSFQNDPDPDQDTDMRREEQLRAFELTQKGGILMRQAAERVIAERHSRALANDQGIELVDPSTHFGDAATARRHRIYDTITDPSAVVAAIDDTGALAYYSIETPAAVDPEPLPSPTAPTGTGSASAADSQGGDEESEAPPTPAKQKTEKSTAGRAAATKSRRAAAERIALEPPPKTDMLQIFADLYALNAIAEVDWSAVETLASKWGLETMAAPTNAKARLARAWITALAAYEIHAAAKSQWGEVDKLYYALLRDRAKYEPGPWEREQLDNISEN
ncbi:hypothetical protein E3G68_005069 [Mycobacteroides abscessus]|nr:hypothetical protein [Mycobacteroides abscessus]